MKVRKDEVYYYIDARDSSFILKRPELRKATDTKLLGSEIMLIALAERVLELEAEIEQHNS